MYVYTKVNFDSMFFKSVQNFSVVCWEVDFGTKTMR